MSTHTFAGREIARIHLKIEDIVHTRLYQLQHLSRGDAVSGMKQDGQDTSESMSCSDVNLVMPRVPQGRPRLGAP